MTGVTDEDFHRVVEGTYRRQPHRRPYAALSEKWLTDVHRRRFGRRLDMRFFVARSDGEAVGRTAAIVNHDHNDLWEAADAFLGFFECADAEDVARELLAHAEKWAASLGMRRLLATASPSLNYSTGVQVAGFDSPPVLLLNWNPPYYGRLLRRCGFHPMIDWSAWSVLRERLGKRARTMLKRDHAWVDEGLRFRYLVAAESESWRDPIRKIYNDSFADEWGFVPMGVEEFEEMLSRLRAFWLDDLSLLAEQDGVPIAFMMTVDAPRGRRRRGHPQVVLLCVSQRHRGRQVGFGLAVEFIRRFLDSGRRVVEFHMREGNPFMEKLRRSLRAVVSRRYCLFAREIEPTGGMLARP